MKKLNRSGSVILLFMYMDWAVGTFLCRSTNQEPSSHSKVDAMVKMFSCGGIHQKQVGHPKTYVVGIAMSQGF